MTSKYKAIDVANYILWYANENHKNAMVTALKLHKLVYYVAARYANDFNEFLFEEKIEKWQYGPVTPSVYHAFKGRGYNHISKPAAKFEFTEEGFKQVEFDSDAIDAEEKTLFNEVIDQLINKTARYLVEATHREDAWKNNKQEILGGTRDLPYSLEELKKATIPQ